MIQLLYFGVLKETLGLEREVLDWSGGSTAQLLARLRARGEDWERALAPERVFRLAINQELVIGDVDIPLGAEVGILPPVTGG